MLRLHCTSDTPHYENVPFEVPESWRVVSLSELFTLNPKNEVEDNAEVGFIPMTNVEDGFSGDHTFEVREWKDVKKGYCHFQNGDIGVAKISPCFENLKSCIFHSLPNGNGAGTTELVILRSFGVYSPFYLYLFKSSWYISQGTKYFKGVVGQQRVNKAIFTELEVPLPSYREQQRIVAEIEKWFNLIDAIESGKTDLQSTIKQAKNKILDLAIHGKLVPQDSNDEPALELLKRINPNAEITCDNGQYGKVPNGWVCASVSDCNIDILNGYAFQSSKYTNEGIRIIRIANVQDGYIEDDSPKYYPLSSISEYERFILKSDDLLMSLTGNVGRVGFLPKSMLPAVLNQRVACIRSNGVCTKFLFYFFRTNIFKNECMASAKGVAQLNISTEWLKEYTIMVPPLAEQHRIVAKIEELFNQLDQIEKSLEA